MNTPLWKATVHNGLLKIEKDSDYRRFLNTLEGDVVLTVKRPQKPRSNAENRYYWKCIVEPLAIEFFGDSPDEKQNMHETLRWKFLLDNKNGIPCAKSTTELSTVEMESYLSQIRMWASAELSFYIPLPNEVDYENLPTY